VIPLSSASKIIHSMTLRMKAPVEKAVNIYHSKKELLANRL
jgi:hypothetical protein